MNIGKKIASVVRQWWSGGRNMGSPSISAVRASTSNGNGIASPNPFEVAVQGIKTLKASLSVVEICAGYWSRAFENAQVFIDGKPIREYQINGGDLSLRGTFDVGIKPMILSMIGRQMITSGDAKFKIVTSTYNSPKVLLIPALSTDITGISDPSSWQYNLEVQGPDGQDEQTKEMRSRKEKYPNTPSSEVVHVMYATYPETPWIGVSPLQLSGKTYQTLKNLEDMFQTETDLPTGMIFPVEDGSPVGITTGDPVEYADYVSNKLTEEAGGMVVLARPSSDIANADRPLPADLLKQIRYGFLAENANSDFRQQLMMNIVEACGLPASIVVTDRGSRAVRDGMRQFTDMTIAPKFRSVSDELSQKLGMNVAIYADKSFDAGTTARAVGTLTRSMGTDGEGNPLPGIMSAEDAARVVGLPPELFRA